MKQDIHPIVIPKWGMTMDKAVLGAWRVEEGATVAAGDELIDIETEKIANAVEAAQAGILRRQVGKPGQTYSCGALIGVITDADVSDEEITAFVAEHAQAAIEVSAEGSGAAPRSVDVRGHTLRYLQRGSGDVPIVLVHGFGGDLNNWLFVQPSLSDRWVTYAVDLPGHGGSSKDLAGINSLAEVADLLVGFLDQVAIDRVHVVAHSMGAAIALSLARRYGERVRSLVLLDPVGLGNPPAQEFIDGLIAAKSRREMGEVLKMLLADERQVSRDMVNDLLKYKRIDGVEPTLRRYAEFLPHENHAAAEALAGVKAPIHIVWGVEDRIVRPLTQSELPRNIHLTLVEGAGHMPHLERSSRTVELIERALTR
jgi:pyruvate dehydrogenase E2 component (dihydrolipoamide acetyltransferase)